MKMNNKQFLGLRAESPLVKDAQVVILPFPYEGGVSYGTGTGLGPDAIIDASHHLELYDEYLKVETNRIGISTAEPPKISQNPEEMIKIAYKSTGLLLDQDKFVVLVGGDHSITSGYVKALLERHKTMSVIHLDAHADLRESYQNSKLSHACVMSRIREMTQQTLQIGIRSLSLAEAERIKDENIQICTICDYRNRSFDIDEALEKLPDPVFITFDVDVFDWSVVRSTGTPEPGGMFWDETISLLEKIFTSKNVIGFDVVELAANETDPNSAFAVAKLIYRMIGFKFVVVS